MTKNNLISLFILCTLCIPIFSCSWNSFREQLGVSKEAPDEFLVEQKQDLTIPREFTLPKPGEKTKKSPSSNESAEQLLFGNKRNTTNTNSALDKNFSKKAGLENNSDIRNTIEREYSEETSVFGVKKGGLLEKIVDPFGYNRTKPKVVDGYKENQRVREAISKGEKIDTDEEEVEIIEGW